MNNTVHRFGGAFGVAIATAVFAARRHLGSPAGMVAGYLPAITAEADRSLLGALAAAAVSR